MSYSNPINKPINYKNSLIKKSLAKVEKVISDREDTFNRTNPSKGITLNPNTYEHNNKHENKNTGPVGPKLALFDGKGDWIAYLLQFTTIADRYKWSNEQRLSMGHYKKHALFCYFAIKRQISTKLIGICMKAHQLSIVLPSKSRLVQLRIYTSYPKTCFFLGVTCYFSRMTYFWSFVLFRCYDFIRSLYYFWTIPKTLIAQHYFCLIYIKIQKEN